MCIQNPTSMITFLSPNTTSFLLRSFCIRASDFKPPWSEWLWDYSEHALLDSIAVSSCLCAVRLNGSVQQQSIEASLFILSVCVPTDCSSSEAKDEFYLELSWLLRSVRSNDLVVVVGYFNAEPGYLTAQRSLIFCASWSHLQRWIISSKFFLITGCFQWTPFFL